MASGLQIGKAARATGLTVDTIRFYQRIGLFKVPARTSGGYRVFTENEIEDLQFIGKAQELGFSLSEIRELTLLRQNAAHACPEVRALIRRKLATIEEKIAALQHVHAELTRSLRMCNRALKSHTADDRCPILTESKGENRKVLLDEN
jgi:DNA-binding transcriptional MerR regulator